jgi:8-oxo-dGTP diphosphatase
MINGQEISVSAKGAVIRDGKLLVVRYDKPYLHYNLPGGRLRNGEGLREAVVRKLHEECLADVEVARLLFVYEHVPNPAAPLLVDYQKVQFTFLAELRPGSEPCLPTGDGDEDGVDWIDLADVPTAPIEPPVAEKLVAALRAVSRYDPLLTDVPEPVLS